MYTRNMSFRIWNSNPVSTKETVCLWHPTTLIWVASTVPRRWPSGEEWKDILKHQQRVGTRSFLAKDLLDPLQAGSGAPLPMLFGSVTGRIIIWVTKEWAKQQKHGHHFPRSLLQMPTVIPGPTRQKAKGWGTGGRACSTLLCPGDFRSHSAWVCDKLKYKWGRRLLNGGQNPWGLFWNNFLHNRSLSKIPLTNCNKILVGMESIPSFLVIWIFHVYLYSQ